MVYDVLWVRDSVLAKGKGRVKKDEIVINFTVICGSSNDAIKCLEFVFREQYRNNNGLSLSDGVITLKRSKVDSRGFYPNYMLMDGIREPIYLHNLKSNALRAQKIFGI